VPSRMVGVSASVNLPLHHKVPKFSSGTGSPGWSRKKGHKMVVVWRGGARWLVTFVCSDGRLVDKSSDGAGLDSASVPAVG